MNIKNIIVSPTEPIQYTNNVKGFAWLNGNSFKYIDELGVKQIISNNSVPNTSNKPQELLTNNWDITATPKVFINSPLSSDLTINVSSLNGDSGELVVIGNNKIVTLTDNFGGYYTIETELLGATLIEYKNFNNIMAVTKKTLVNEVFQSINYIECSFIDNSIAILKWNNTFADRYLLEYKIFGTNTWNTVNNNIQYVNAEGFVEFTLSGLTANTSYDIRIKAEYINGFSSFKEFFISNKVILNLFSAFQNPSQQQITWDVPASFFTVGVDTYNVQIKRVSPQIVGDTNAYTDWTYVSIPNIGITTNNTVVSNLDLNRDYEYRVGFYKKGFKSNWSQNTFTHQAL